MTRVLYVDAGHGISSGALLGALVDLGAAPSPILRAVNSIPVELSLRFETGGDGARAIATRGPETPALLPVAAVHDLLDRAEDLSERAREGTKRVYTCLANAQLGDAVPLWAGEGETILHVAGALEGIEALAPERVMVSPVDIGCGAHAPAVVELMGDHVDEIRFENPSAKCTTALGAALLCSHITPDGFGTPAPAWRAHPMRGRGLRAAVEPLTVALGATDA